MDEPISTTESERDKKVFGAKYWNGKIITKKPNG